MKPRVENQLDRVRRLGPWCALLALLPACLRRELAERAARGDRHGSERS